MTDGRDEREQPLSEWTVEELRHAAQGCTELTCLYHGPLTQELRDRGEPRYEH
jgi:hypothetical protein